MPGGGLARVAVPRARMSVARPIRGGPAPAATAKASSGGAWLKNLWQKRIKRNMSRALAAVNSRAGGPQDTRDGGAPRASPLPVGVVPPAPRTGVKRGTHPKLRQARRGRLALTAVSHEGGGNAARWDGRTCWRRPGTGTARPAPAARQATLDEFVGKTIMSQHFKHTL